MNSVAKKGELTVADIATWKGCSRWTAWRWLVDKERQYGERVVWRRRGQLLTSHQALGHVVADPVPQEIDRRIERRLHDLEGARSEQESRIDGLYHEIVQLRRELRRLSSAGPKLQHHPSLASGEK